jgi:hypothetical protein
LDAEQSKRFIKTPSHFTVYSEVIFMAITGPDFRGLLAELVVQANNVQAMVPNDANITRQDMDDDAERIVANFQHLCKECMDKSNEFFR